MPEPLPTSRTESPGRMRRSISTRQSWVQGCWPVPHWAPGLISRRRRPGGVGSLPPGGDDEEFFADQERRPGVLGALDPVDVFDELRVAEVAGVGFVLEEGFKVAVAFGDAGGAVLPEVGDEGVVVGGLGFQADGEHQSWLISGLGRFLVKIWDGASSGLVFSTSSWVRFAVGLFRGRLGMVSRRGFAWVPGEGLSVSFQSLPGFVSQEENFRR